MLYACSLKKLQQQASLPLGRRGSLFALHVLHACKRSQISQAFCAWVQIIGPTDDGKQYDQEDAQLQLDQGQPRCVFRSILSLFLASGQGTAGMPAKGVITELRSPHLVLLALDWYLLPHRFYVMRLPQRGLTFDRITFHAKVCATSEWYYSATDTLAGSGSARPARTLAPGWLSI